jgi:radical SAM protein with 4Fe4S-binding SPASM domain
MSRSDRRYLRLNQPDYREKRGGNVLFVWGRIPYWTVVDEELAGFMDSLDGERTMDELLNATSIPGQIVDFLRNLVRVGAITDIRKPDKAVSQPRLDAPLIENISINLTRRCNLRCAFCYNLNSLYNDDSDELEAAEIIEFIDRTKAFRSPPCTFIILGGEPLLYPDKLLSVARHAIRQGMDTLVSTNGIPVTEEIARQAKELGLQVQVSLDGHNAALNDRVRGTGSFDRALAGVKILVRNGVHTILSMVCHEGNANHLEEYYRFASEMGVNEARFIPLKRMGGGSGGCFTPAKTKDLILESTRVLTQHPEYLRLMGRDAFSILAATCGNSARRRSCGTGLQTLLLDSDASIYPCLNTNAPEFRVANIRDKGFNFAQIWRESPILRNIRLLTAVNNSGEQCSACPVLYWCLGGCRGETYALTGKLDDVPYNCEDWKQSIIEMFWILAERPDLAKPSSIMHK